MFKIGGQWDEQAVTSPLLNAVNEIFGRSSASFETRQWTKWSFEKFLTCPNPGNRVRKGVETGIWQGHAHSKMRLGCMEISIVDNSSMQ